MNTAAEKPVKKTEFTSKVLVREGEHVLFAVIIGPDVDEPGRKELHLRAVAAAVEFMREELKPEAREMILQHLDRLVAEFRKMVGA